jgi:uncharacterized RDD family membrane protein YckC
MKCPKCGYLGFETGDRCRNCGYDFSLTIVPASAIELPLNDTQGAGSALADFDLARATSAAATKTPPDLDLDRLIGVDVVDAVPAEPVRVAHDPGVGAGRLSGDDGAGAGLPLFSDMDASLGRPSIAPPRPMGPPLVVRRATPEIPRGRPRGVRPPKRDVRPLALEPEAAEQRTMTRPSFEAVAPEAPPPLQAASRTSRLLAAGIDLVLLGSINLAVLYLTLRIADLTTADIGVLPPVPMASFLLLLDGGYLAALTTAGGKTIGKMTTGIRVIGDDGRAVDGSRALLRAAGGLLTVLALGLPYLPVLFSGDGRALADRLAGTRVVRSD